MKLERIEDQDRGRAESADRESRERRDAVDDGWAAIAVSLAAIVIALCIASGVLEDLQREIQRTEGSVRVFAQPQPVEQRDGAQESLNKEIDSQVADSFPAPEGRMYDTEAARWWVGGYSTTTPRPVY